MKNRRKLSRKEREEKGKKTQQTVRGERDRIGKVRQARWKKERRIKSSLMEAALFSRC